MRRLLRVLLASIVPFAAGAMAAGVDLRALAVVRPSLCCPLLLLAFVVGECVSLLRLVRVELRNVLVRLLKGWYAAAVMAVVATAA